MSKFKLAFSNVGSIIPPGDPGLSDLVSLGILPKPIAEFTNDDIGTEISIPYTDAGGVISGPILFEVVGVNHHTSEEHQQTITLMTKNIIRYAAFDAKEPNNPLYDEMIGINARAERGNNRWSVSNIRQWLNSSGAANEWFTAQHEYDEAPTTDKVFNEPGAYADEPGFLAGFSPEVLQHFTNITNITALCNADGDGSETTVDKVFLPSYTEMGFGNNNEIAEGTHLSVRYPDNNSRNKSGANGLYWMRSTEASSSYNVWLVDSDSIEGANYAYSSDIGITPLVVLH